MSVVSFLFQSLFWWNILLRLKIRSRAISDLKVSILVLVEYPSEVSRHFQVRHGSGVSILVLVEYPSEVVRFLNDWDTYKCFNPCSGGISF